MSNAFELTKRQKIRLRSRIQSAVIFVVALGLVALAIFGAIRAQAVRREKKAAQAAQAAQQEALAMEQADQTAQPPVEEAVPARPDVDITAWNLQLVRYEYQLEEDFSPELVDIENGQRFDARAAAHLKALIQAARDAGYSVYFCSGFRDYETQSIIYWNHMNDYMDAGMTAAEAHAKTVLSVNYPGASEHQLGLAADLLEYKDQEMESWIGGSGLMLWLEENCADYGFVIRYPEGKTDVTGISYEPWHLRYVGGEAARYMMENGLCLEEFLALYE